MEAPEPIPATTTPGSRSTFATLAFWIATGERALKTFAQTLLVLIVAQPAGILDLDWGQSFSLAGMAAIASILTSISNAAPGPGTDIQKSH